MEFLNIHLQLALINSSQKPMKSIINKYPKTFCNDDIKSLINKTIFDCIDQCDNKGKVFFSFSHLENYFFSSLWHEVERLYKDEKFYIQNCTQFNDNYNMGGYGIDESQVSESAEEEFMRNDSYLKLCKAIQNLEKNELRNRAVRSLKRSAFLKKVANTDVSDDISWYLKQAADAETLGDESLGLIKAIHLLGLKGESFKQEHISLIANLRAGSLSEIEIQELMGINQEDEHSSNLYGFAQRFIEEENIHSSLLAEKDANKTLISGQRHMIRRELRQFKRG